VLKCFVCSNGIVLRSHDHLVLRCSVCSNGIVLRSRKKLMITGSSSLTYEFPCRSSLSVSYFVDLKYLDILLL